jgi:hypothetical protein
MIPAKDFPAKDFPAKDFPAKDSSEGPVAGEDRPPVFMDGLMTHKIATGGM